MQANFEQNKQFLQNEVANIIKSYRLKQSKSISQVSAEIGMTKSMWADLEKKIKDPQLSTLWRISEGLEIPLSEIIIELEKKLGNDFSLIC